MGRHPCNSCGKEGWDYSQQLSEICHNGICTYWDGIDICPECMVYVDCERCGLSGCDHCIVNHCEKCDSDLCATCIEYGLDTDEDDDDDDDKEPKREPVEEVTFPLCGHISCNGFVEAGAVLEYCKPCATANNEQENQKRMVIQRQLEKDDAIIIKTMQSQFKSESLKGTVTSWFRSCKILQYDAVEPAPKKLRVENEVVDLT